MIPRRIEELNIKWSTSAPFLSYFLSKFSYRQEKMGTIGVGFHNNSLFLVYDLEFLNKLPDNELEGVMVHEILHILKMNIARGQGKDKRLFNVATDIINNEDIINNFTIGGNSLKLPDFALRLKHVEEMGYDDRKDIAEYIYSFLLKKRDETLKSFDQHLDIENMTDEEKAQLQSVIQKTVKGAKTQGWGNMGGSLTSYIDNLLKPKKIPIRKILRNSIHNITYGHTYNELTYAKRNRRGFSILPGKKYYSNKLNIVVDTSGSCFTKETLQLFFSEIDYISEHIDIIKIIQFDTKVTRVSNYKKGEWRKYELKGGGGTEIQPVFDYIYKNKESKVPTVILTDGYLDFNLNLYGCKPLWVLSESTSIPYNNKVYLNDK